MSRPNIMILMTDHQRADTVLPEHPCLTPNLDAFGQNGLYLTETYCPSPHCCPARATFFTGLYPSGHGVWNNICNDQALSRGLKPGVRCWSEDLRAAGYDLRFTGKWHVSVEEGPAERGWRTATVSCGKGESHGQSWGQFEKMVPPPVAAPRRDGEIVRPGWGNYQLYATAEHGMHRHDERVTTEACDLLSDLAGGQEPWCLYAGLVGPHDPYYVPGRYLDMYDLDKVPLPRAYNDRHADKPGLYRRMREQIWDQLSEREVREGVRHFWAFCTYLDDLFGRILRRLEETGQAENTLVLYCADHGDYCGEHGLFAKSIPCFKGAYQVPAVLRWPAGLRRPGRRESSFVSLADFGPTFLDLAGVQTDQHFAGRSLTPFIRDETPADWRDAIFTQCNGVEIYAMQRSIMTKRHKLVYNAFDQDELYDLTQDPDEMVNRQADPGLANEKRELYRQLWRFAHEQGDVPPNAYITLAMAPHGPGLAFAE